MMMMMMMRATSLAAAATVFLFWSAHAEDILLASQIRSIVDRPEYLGCKWGIQAQMTNTSIEDGGLIYSNPGASLFSVPASNGKIPTTFAAWLSLGPDYTFETSIGMSVSDDGTRANLTLCGSNDPSMTSVQLEAAAQATVTSQPLLAAAASVTVRVDNRRGSDATFPGSWEWGDLQYYYGAPPASVILDGNVVAVQIEANEEDGGEDGLAVVTLPDPGSEQCFTVVNEVRTTAPGSSTSVAGSFEVRSGNFSLVLTGTVASSSSSYGSFDMYSDNGNNSSSSGSTSSTSTSTSTSPVVLTVSCRDPLRRAGDALVSFLQDAGITAAKAAGDNDNGDELGGGFVVTNAPECDGNVVGRPQTVPAAAAATITSERLEILLNHTLLESDNTFAEAIFRRQGSDGSYGESMQAVRSTLAAWQPEGAAATSSSLTTTTTMTMTTAVTAEKEVGLEGGGMPVLDLAQYSAYDGSGLSRHDLVCPSFLAALMAFADERYLQLLPLAGVSGTLSSRFIGTAAEGKLRAKTGTMTNVNALSGVVGNVAFSILSDSCPQPSSVVRQGIDDIAVLFAEL